MPRPSPTEILEHPGYTAALEKGLCRAGIPDFGRYQVEKLLAVAADPDRLQCCHSGCIPCMQQIKNCLRVVYKELAPKRKRRFLFF